MVLFSLCLFPLSQCVALMLPNLACFDIFLVVPFALLLPSCKIQQHCLINMPLSKTFIMSMWYLGFSSERTEFFSDHVTYPVIERNCLLSESSLWLMRFHDLLLFTNSPFWTLNLPWAVLHSVSRLAYLVTTTRVHTGRSFISYHPGYPPQYSSLSAQCEALSISASWAAALGGSSRNFPAPRT